MRSLEIVKGYLATEFMNNLPKFITLLFVLIDFSIYPVKDILSYCDYL